MDDTLLYARLFMFALVGLLLVVRKIEITWRTWRENKKPLHL